MISRLMVKQRAREWDDGIVVSITRLPEYQLWGRIPA
jgi:hypothetical protein